MNNRVLMETKEAEQTLTLEKAALEDLNRMKTEFWGNASHEMRTPLTVISVNVQTVDFSSLLRSSADIFFLHLNKQGNLLKTDIADGLTVFGNADLLAQVLANLLQNAAAYTKQGEITLQAKKTGHEISVTVQDTGTGISPELQPHVFERGVSTGGTGFGLYLCRTVVESHGGRIWIESASGGGTLAAFVLPTYEGQYGGEKHG